MTTSGWASRLGKLDPARFTVVAAAVEMAQGLSVYLPGSGLRAATALLGAFLGRPHGRRRGAAGLAPVPLGPLGASGALPGAGGAALC